MKSLSWHTNCCTDVSLGLADQPHECIKRDATTLRNTTETNNNCNKRVLCFRCTCSLVKKTDRCPLKLLPCVTLKAGLSAAFGTAFQVPDSLRGNETLEHISLSHRGPLRSSLWKPGSQGALTYGIITAVSLKAEDLKKVAGEREIERERKKGGDKSTK